MPVIRPCRKPRCPNTAGSRGLCSEHEGELESYRPRAKQKAWAAKVIQRAGGLCEGTRPGLAVGSGDELRCRRPATQAHHVRPLHSFAPSRREEAWELSNGQALCNACHRRVS